MIFGAGIWKNVGRLITLDAMLRIFHHLKLFRLLPSSIKLL